ncbi:hypothetical protein M0638_20510 [Roseomonas sp. NAR14]|uniref:Ribbon-helix-helix protein CopG domain-containing protein n=1 Tax=Roseomonas acroporae TaxID=2937791 RepID=A0A9X1YCS9_9PROT|nr:hypothetical protein [Roseomonas acroporae]MCK8786758.1 hypothetical protein [Roseomonas acroporae]
MNRKPTRFELRLPPELGDEIDRWRREQPDLPPRAEAARRLIELGLEAAKPRPQAGGGDVGNG